jgi:2-methylisocitrate lyase-like PEP mutase family enzyme
MHAACDAGPVTDDLRARFRELHRPGDPLVMPNAWDAGSAKLLESLGFAAIATTSSGFAATLGRHDGEVTRDEAIAHTDALAAATTIPVNADLEDCFADDPEGVAATIAAAAATGAAGASVEDYGRDPARPIHELGLARERVAAAVAAAGGLVITARAENLIRGVDDLDDTIRRLQAYQEAGADVLYAPGLRRTEDIRAVVTSVDRPVNALMFASGLDVAALAEAGVARISVGGALAWVSWAAAADAARRMLSDGAPFDREVVKAGGDAVTAALR